METNHKIYFICAWNTQKSNGIMQRYSRHFEDLETFKNYISKNSHREWDGFYKMESWIDENNVHCGKGEYLHI